MRASPLNWALEKQISIGSQMSELDIAFWAMIGTWVAGLATFLAVVVSLYLSVSSRRTKLSLSLLKTNNNYELDVLNRGHVYGEISKINLVRKSYFQQDMLLGDSDWDDLIGYYFFDMEDEIKNKKALTPGEPSSKFEISMSSLFQQYDKFLPYENGLLTKPTKMEKCHVRVSLRSGEHFYVPLPKDFYAEYRHQIGHSLDDELYRLTNEPWKFYVYHSSTELREKQMRFLGRYAEARNNYHLLFF